MTGQSQPLAEGSPSRDKRDYYAGGLAFLLGIGAMYEGLNYHVGTLTRMGPGYFPVAVGAVLAAMGVVIALGACWRARAKTVAAAKLPLLEWRGWACIILANLAFVVLGHHGGLVPATFAVVFISALGDRQNNFKSALLLALGIVGVCIVLFSWALQLQFPLFQWR